MHFRGGGIGHKVTHEWDEFLQCEGHEPPLDDEDIGDADLQSEDSEDELEWDIEVRVGGTDGGGDEVRNSESEESKGEEDDVIIADEGEELDEDIWAQEQYGSL